jgi:hypothetical protein
VAIQGERNLRNKNYVGIVIDDHEDDVVRFCRYCLVYDVKIKLGPRQAKHGDERGPDWDLFMQCPNCGKITPKHEEKQEQEVSAFVEVTDNPFDDGVEILGARPKRNSPAGIKERDKRMKERNRMHHKDKEIDDAIRQFGEENVKVVYDSDP